MIFKYNCTCCKYKTDNKSNYNKHMKSARHAKNNSIINFIDETSTLDNKGEILSTNENEYMCQCCGKKYAHASGLSKHKKNGCDQIDIFEHTIEVQNKRIDRYEKIFDKLVEKSTETTKSITYNISVKNYVQQNYNNAPALKALKTYELLAIDDEDESFIDKLIFHYNHKLLHIFFGNFIVEQYKTDDPAQQSLWNSDVSRLTYIVKQLIANGKKESIWINDPKGNKTKESIITPMLKYVHKYIKDFIQKEASKIRLLPQDESERLNNKLKILSDIITNISDNVLTEDIIKYMAPHFYLKNNSIEQATDI